MTIEYVQRLYSRKRKTNLDNCKPRVKYDTPPYVPVPKNFTNWIVMYVLQ